MTLDKAGLFGIKYSNRDFTQKNTWGKNQFNSSFPAALSAYLQSKNFENIYLTLDSNLNVVHGKLSTTDFFGLEPTSKVFFLTLPFDPYFLI